MTGVVVRGWASWAPGIESPEAWRSWARAPRPLTEAGSPEIRFLPSLQRRRFDPLGRMLIHVARECCPPPLLSEVACVVASRHGPFSTTLSLLEDLAVETPLSPVRFSHSVHNTHAGLFSIWAQNRVASSSIAARAETFVHGFVEALGLLQRTPGRSVLLLYGDELLPAVLAELAERRPGSHALALLLAASGEGDGVELRLEPGPSEPAPHRLHPEALEFLRWWLSGEPTLRCGHGPRTWVWCRVPGAPGDGLYSP